MNNTPITAKQQKNSNLYSVYEGNVLIAKDLPPEKAFSLMDELRFKQPAGEA